MSKQEFLELELVGSNEGMSLREVVAVEVGWLWHVTSDCGLIASFAVTVGAGVGEGRKIGCGECKKGC